MEVILASIIERSNRLLQHVATVHKALLEIVNLTTSSQTDGRSTDNTHHVSATPIKSKLQQATVTSSSTGEKRRGSLSNKSTPQHEPSSRMLSGSNKHTSTNSMVYATTPTHGLTELTLHQFGLAGEEVLNHFCKLVSQAVIKAVLHSHSKFLSSLHATGVAEAMAYSNPDTRASSTEKSVKFSTEIKKDRDTLYSENHLSLSDAIPGPLLQLTVDVHFATPRIQLEPTLDSVHSDLMEVSDVLLRVLHQVKWWARPNAGRTLYEVYEVGAKENAMRDVILKSVQGNQISVVSYYTLIYHAKSCTVDVDLLYVSSTYNIIGSLPAIIGVVCDLLS